jgi:beta-glucanase (GH16 family)
MHPKPFYSLITAGLAVSLAAHPVDPYEADFGEPPQRNGMTLVWHDEFNVDGKPDPANWKYETGFVRNEELQWYQSDNVNCKDGLLVIDGKRQSVVNPNYVQGSADWKKNRPTAEYTSGSIYTQKLQEFQYGRFEIRARIDTTQGSWPAIWAKGATGSWPFCGEIDIMEFYRRQGVPVLLANLAWGSATNASGKWNTKRIPLSHFTDVDNDWQRKFHVWSMEWTTDSIRLFLDDELLNSQRLSDAVNPAGYSPATPFQQKHYFLLNLAIGSNGGDPNVEAFPIRFEVDYFRVYQDADKASLPVPLKVGRPLRRILVTDSAGRRIVDCDRPESDGYLQALSPGIYFVHRFFTGGESIVGKIIKH